MNEFMYENYMQEITEKTHSYNEYILEHQNNVRKAWQEMQEKCEDEQFVYDDFWHGMINYAIKHHDMSKYDAEEFTQYRNFFYPCKYETVDKEAFNTAWKHHYRANCHHWEHWMNEDGTFRGDIDAEYSATATVNQVNNYIKIYTGYVEMICDMTAMGYKFGDNALTYYEKNKHEIKILPNWVNMVERIMKKMAT